MDIKSQINKIRKLPIEVTIKKTISKPIKNIYNKKHRGEDLLNCTYYTVLPTFLNENNHIFLKLKNKEILLEYQAEINANCDDVLAHRFDLLGSGPVEVKFGLEPAGIDGFSYKPKYQAVDRADWLEKMLTPSNKEYSKKINSLISPDYQFIDWQIDFKSGYSWEANTWYKDIKYGNFPMVDIKVPWELGRMQYLPQLALGAFVALANSNQPRAARLAQEFSDQIFDFISSNPPRFGVQWTSSMDVAIRLTNWVFAYQLFELSGFEFNQDFQDIFKLSIFEHILHIYSNLEWSEGMRANHYLANICGLLFGTAFLPKDEQIKKIRKFAQIELFNEIEYQFNDDGGNFEASTPYHCFATEMLFWALYAFVNSENENLINKKLNKNTIQKLLNIIEFTQSIIKPNGEIDQIGDNDSGFFIRLLPFRQINNRLNLIALFSTFFNQDIEISKEFPALEKKLFVSDFSFSANTIEIPSIELNNISNETSKVSKHHDFGLYIYQNKYYHSTVRCGSIGQNGKGGHSHNDQLSFTLHCNGNDYIVDSGTYIYTPMPKVRNMYRSTQMHNTLKISTLEQNIWNEKNVDDLFWFDSDRTKSKCLNCSEHLFDGEHFGYGEPHRRKINFGEKIICGNDVCTVPVLKTIQFHVHPDIIITEKDSKSVILTGKDGTEILFSSEADLTTKSFNYSEGYGIKQKTKKIIINFEDDKISWKFEIL